MFWFIHETDGELIVLLQIDINGRTSHDFFSMCPVTFALSTLFALNCLEYKLVSYNYKMSVQLQSLLVYQSSLMKVVDVDQILWNSIFYVSFICTDQLFPPKENKYPRVIFLLSSLHSPVQRR